MGSPIIEKGCSSGEILCFALKHASSDVRLLSSPHGSHSLYLVRSCKADCPILGLKKGVLVCMLSHFFVKWNNISIWGCYVWDPPTLMDFSSTHRSKSSVGALEWMVLPVGKPSYSWRIATTLPLMILLTPPAEHKGCISSLWCSMPTTSSVGSVFSSTLTFFPRIPLLHGQPNNLWSACLCAKKPQNYTHVCWKYISQCFCFCHLTRLTRCHRDGLDGCHINWLWDVFFHFIVFILWKFFLLYCHVVNWLYNRAVSKRFWGCSTTTSHANNLYLCIKW